MKESVFTPRSRRRRREQWDEWAVIAIDFAGHRTGNKLNWHCPIAANYNLSAAPPAAPTRFKIAVYIPTRGLKFSSRRPLGERASNFRGLCFISQPRSAQTLLLPGGRIFAVHKYIKWSVLVTAFYYSGRVCFLFLISDFYDAAAPNAECNITVSHPELFYWSAGHSLNGTHPAAGQMCTTNTRAAD